jgi:hypothetical protein
MVVGSRVVVVIKKGGEERGMRSYKDRGGGISLRCGGWREIMKVDKTVGVRGGGKEVVVQ